MRHRRRPLYSACNEDSRSELRALDPGPGDTVVAVAAGGGRVLSLLGAGPARLLAVDLRPEQVINLELKAAAMDLLDHAAYLRFLGHGESDDRVDVYALIRPSLSPSARRYWDARPGLIRQGVLYAGRTERALHHYAACLRRAGLFQWPERLLACTSLEEQHAVLAEEASAVRRGEALWHLFVNRVLFYAAAQDPSFLRSTHRSMGRYLYRRFIRYATRHLLRDSFFAQLIYRGRYALGGALPPYLEPQGFERARKNLDALEIHCSRLDDVVARARPRGRVKWSLSDVSSWMSEAQFHSLVRTLVAVGAPGSRLCARNFAAHRSLPGDMGRRARRLDDCCRILDDEDSSMFYRFEVLEYAGFD